MSVAPLPVSAENLDSQVREISIEDITTTTSFKTLGDIAKACSLLVAGESMDIGTKQHTRVEVCIHVLQRHAAALKVDTTTNSSSRDEPVSPGLLSGVYAVLGESLERQAAGNNGSSIETNVTVSMHAPSLTKDETRRQCGSSSRGHALVKMNSAQCLQKALDLDMGNARAWYILGCVVTNLHQELSLENDIARDGDNAGTLASRKIRKIAVESKVRKGTMENSTTVRLESGRFTATQCFSQAVALNPKLSGAWLNLGSALAKDAARHAAEMRTVRDTSQRTAAPPPCVIAGDVISREECYIREISLDFRTPVSDDDPDTRAPDISITSGGNGTSGSKGGLAANGDRPLDQVPQHRRRARAFAWLNLAGCLQGIDHTITIQGRSFTRKRCLIQSITECNTLPMAWTNLAANMYGEEVALIPHPTISGQNMRAGRVECLIKAIELTGNNNDAMRHTLAPTAYPWINIAAVLFEEMTNDGRTKRSECTRLPLSSASLVDRGGKGGDQQGGSLVTERLFDCIDCIEEALARDPRHYMGWFNAALMLNTLEEDTIPPPVCKTDVGVMLGLTPEAPPRSQDTIATPVIRHPSITVGGIVYSTPVHCLIKSLTIEEGHGEAWYQLGQMLYYCPRDPTGDATAEINGQVYNSEECYSRATELGEGSRTRCCTIQ